jgi:hypothetical protein
MKFMTIHEDGTGCCGQLQKKAKQSIQWTGDKAVEAEYKNKSFS